MRSKSGYARNSIPRFYIKLGKDIIWDYPKDFAIKDIDYGYWADNNGISQLVQDYIDTPISRIFESSLCEVREYDGLNIDLTTFNYNLISIFIAADRRLGKERLIEFLADSDNIAAKTIFSKRYE